MEEKVENVKVEKPKKTRNKKKIFGIIAGVVSVVVAGVIAGAAILGNNPTDNTKNYQPLKTQTEITRDIGTFKTSDDYFIQGEKGIYRFYKEQDKNIMVVVADDVDQRYYDGYQQSVEFLNKTFDVVNDKYEWEITRASELGGEKAHIYIQNGELSGEVEMESQVKNTQDMITSSVITIDDADADKLPDEMVNVACLHEMMHTLGLQDMQDRDYYGRTIMYPYNTYTHKLRLLPYDARNLIAAYADINTPERLEELKKFTIDTKYVANTERYQDLDMDYGNSFDW